MCKILLSINPIYVEKILNGSKRYEFRKTTFTKKVDKIIIYSTKPVMKIVGEVEVLEILQDTPKNIWKISKNFSGVTKDFFENYYKGKKVAIALKLGTIKIYDKPKKLSEFNVKYAPQSFIYL